MSQKEKEKASVQGRKRSLQGSKVSPDSSLVPDPSTQFILLQWSFCRLTLLLKKIIKANSGGRVPVPLGVISGPIKICLFQNQLPLLLKGILCFIWTLYVHLYGSAHVIPPSWLEWSYSLPNLATSFSLIRTLPKSHISGTFHSNSSSQLFLSLRS